MKIINDKFKEAFGEFSDMYVIIGGTANSIILNSEGIQARATKDYDIVIHEEARTEEFYVALLKFLEDGEYIKDIDLLADKEKEGNNLYRFQTRKEEYPQMIELLCRRPYFSENWTGTISPLSFSDRNSLSAIMLDVDYYELVVTNVEIIGGVAVLNKIGLLILKARAWYNLFLDRQESLLVSNHNVSKHIKDISKLVLLFEEDEKIEINESIKKDMKDFLILLNENIDSIPESKDYELRREEVFAILQKLLSGKF